MSLYWAEALAFQTKNETLKNRFANLYLQLNENEGKIINELNGTQGVTVNINGHYATDDNLIDNAMRPSETFNAILA